jgi:tRNA pseudouridine38-40 synthase
VRRHFIHLAFNGANYAGWQIQPNASSVQETLNKALSTLLREAVYVVGAGRTDTGVHARQMFAHFDCEAEFNPTELAFRLNRFLPADIAIKEIFPVDADAHARFSATSRSYQYLLTPQKNPFATNLAWLFAHPLDVQTMNEAATLLLGEKDFGAFSKSNTQTHTNICNVTHAQWAVDGDFLVFSITANRFLRNMVRAIVGSLVNVGQNKTTVAGFQDIITAKNRTLAGESAPAHGLYLTHVAYPKEIVKDGRS